MTPDLLIPRDDIGGVPLEIRTLILPRTEGPVHGLGVVSRMVGNIANGPAVGTREGVH